MRDLSRLFGGFLVVLTVSSCRSATRVVEVPRVDLELSGGNRGYLVGSPPPVSATQKTTRRMVETEIEIPSFHRPTPGTMGPVSLGEVAPPEVDLGEEAFMPGGALPQTYDTYVVKKGDTLWSIAADPAIFGDATRWRRLYEANRDVLKSPDQIRPGMTLRIPREGPGSQGSAEGAATFTK